MKRRLAAILVADAVGYGRRMGEDEVGACDRALPFQHSFWMACA